MHLLPSTDVGQGQGAFESKDSQFTAAQSGHIPRGCVFSLNHPQMIELPPSMLSAKTS